MPLTELGTHSFGCIGACTEDPVSAIEIGAETSNVHFYDLACSDQFGF